ncbi:MAG: DUF4153 domain-containing protein [Moheibacter sp.]
MKAKFFETVDKAGEVILRYPVVLLMALVMAAATIYQLDLDYSNREMGFWILKIILVFSLGISLMFALKILSQRIGKGFLLQSLGILFLIGFYFILPANEDDFTEVYAFLLIPIYILSHLLVSFVAFLSRKNPETDFWQYNKNLFVNLVLTLIFTGVLTGGVELAVLAVDNLFNAGFDSEVYGKIFMALAILGSVFIFLLFNETGLHSLEKKGAYPVVLKFFTQFILIPLLSIYLVILYAYSIKILINWELPRGWVSYLVLAYSLIGILALLLVHPLKDETAKSWVKIFSKTFYFTLIPLVFLLFTAIFTRVLEYGYTEPRYFVLLLAIWLSVVVLYFIFWRNPSIKFIPVSLFLFGLFALVFPYLNTFSVAKRSQKNQLEQILIENELLKDGSINFSKVVADSVLYEIENKFEFLDDRFQRDYIENYFEESARKNLPGRGNWNLHSYFKNVENTTIPYARSEFLKLVSGQSFIETDGYQFIVLPDELAGDGAKLNGDQFLLNNQDNNFKLSLNNAQSVDFLPLIEELFEPYKGSRNNRDVEKLFVETDLGTYHVKVHFKSIHRSDGTEPIYWFDDPLFLIKKN